MLRTSQINRCHAAGNPAAMLAHRQPHRFRRLARVARRFGDNSNFLAPNGLRLVSPKTRWATEGDTRQNWPRDVRPVLSPLPRRSSLWRQLQLLRCQRLALCVAKKASGDTRRHATECPPRQQSPRTSSLFLFPLAPTRSI